MVASAEPAVAEGDSPAVDLPRTDVDADELRASPEFAALRREIGSAVKSAAA
ncbi:hypothetical protein [Nocardia vinacea]|uniref:hypothetical protein n=1 Tax=Nocardia vinacea TaxID=96468 RepID=UPI00031BD76C|nr:hypothetical protein [Nocardia vinacea]